MNYQVATEEQKRIWIEAYIYACEISRAEGDHRELAEETWEEELLKAAEEE